MLPATLAGRRTRLRTRAAASAGAALAAVAVWMVAVPLLGHDLAVQRWDGEGTMAVTLGHVVVTALIAGMAGWAALVVLERLTRRARTVWTAGAVVLLAVSVAMPATAAATTTAAVALSLMHVAVGAVLIPVLARSAR